MTELLQIMQRFAVRGVPFSVEKYGEGHINTTYLAICKDGDAVHKYILQRINDSIFKDVDALMENICGVSDYLAKKIAEDGGDPQKECLQVVKTTDGRSYLRDALGCFRVYVFIDGAVTLQAADSPHLFMLSGVAFGRFQCLLSGYPADKLHQTIPRFHDTRDRFNKFREAIKNDKAGRLKSVRREVKFFRDREIYCDMVTDLIAEGKIPLRVTHNDTKLNNVLIDVQADKPAAVIDYDTIMPGSALYDFGDSIRFGANIGKEDETDLTKVGFSLEYFGAYTRGFLSEAGASLNQKERDYLPFGAVLMTYECGMRFLTDYLDGDVYFRTHHARHNLDRTRTQMKMVADMEASLDKMNAVIKTI